MKRAGALKGQKKEYLGMESKEVNEGKGRVGRIPFTIGGKLIAGGTHIHETC